MEQLVNPHDKFFKEVLSRREAAGDFLRYYLPTDVVRLLDLSSLEMSKDSFVDKELQERFSDLLYKVSLRDGGDAYVYILFEHKSYPEPLIAFHLLRYMVRIWEQSLKQGLKLAPIVPVVVYHGQAEWRIALNFAGLFDVAEAVAAFQLDYRYWLCDLRQYSDEEIRGGAILRVGMLLLKYIFQEEMGERLGEILSLLRELMDRRSGLEYLETVLRYLSQGTDKMTAEDLRKVVEETFPEGGEVMHTIAREWKEQGLQEGLQQGMRHGFLRAIELGLGLKFGSEGLRLYPAILKIEDVDVLDAISEGIKMASRLEEVERIYKPAEA